MGVGDALNLAIIASRSLCVDLSLALDHLIRDCNPWLQQCTFTEERDVLWRQNPPFFVITEITLTVVLASFLNDRCMAVIGY
jgi:hypothetical protein